MPMAKAFDWPNLRPRVMLASAVWPHRAYEHPMKQAALAILVGLGLWASCQPLCARPLTVERLRQAPDDPANFLIDGRYQRGEALLARMRQHGELPDTLRAGRCRFDLAGDTGVAYYVKSCT